MIEEIIDGLERGKQNEKGCRDKGRDKR